jgi:hypothetical protein
MHLLINPFFDYVIDYPLLLFGLNHIYFVYANTFIANSIGDVK